MTLENLKTDRPERSNEIVIVEHNGQEQEVTTWALNTLWRPKYNMLDVSRLGETIKRYRTGRRLT